MKSRTIRMISILLAAATLGGCDRRASAPSLRAQTDAASVSPETWIDKIRIGGDRESGGSAFDPTPEFAPGEPVHLTMEVGSVPPNATIRVAWSGPAGRRMGTETQTPAMGQNVMSFTARTSDAWRGGEYRAEVWVGSEKVAERQFRIVDPGTGP